MEDKKQEEKVQEKKEFVFKIPIKFEISKPTLTEIPREKSEDKKE